MNHFEEAYDLVMGHEGGYVNDPDDRGGETYKGISRKNFPNWEGWDNIDGWKSQEQQHFPEVLKDDEYLQDLVKGFYKKRFWNTLSLDEFDREVSTELFDTAVNMGTRTSGKFLQEALNMLNMNEKIYTDIAVDGGVGPKTLATYEKYMNSRSTFSRSHKCRTLVKVLNMLQGEKYMNIVRKSENQERFFFGWVTNRIGED